MDVIKELKIKAAREKKRIVFPEAFDSRVIRAVGDLVKEGVISPLLIGEERELDNLASGYNVSLRDVKIINPAGSEMKRLLQEIEVDKRLIKAEGPEVVRHPLYLGACMVRAGMAYGLVGGCCNPSSTLFRIVLRIIGLSSSETVLSAFKILFFSKEFPLQSKVLVLADTGVIPDPDSEQLSEIAINTADSLKKLMDVIPRVALLSFSTKGSAEHPLVDKVREGARLAQRKRPDLPIEGELQIDAALFPHAAALKEVKRAEESENVVAGQANVLIFPDLNSGNICSKIFERFVSAVSIGSSLQGLKSPVGHLSRSSSTEDVVRLALLTALR